MLANIIFRRVNNLIKFRPIISPSDGYLDLKSTLSDNNVDNQSTVLLQQQQVRFGRKSFKLKQGTYGRAPLFTADHLIELDENNESESLQFEQIRFAQIWEADSVFYDSVYERFVRYVMKAGKKSLAYKLVDQTFYELKIIQLRRYRKLQEKLAQSKQDGAPKKTVQQSDPTAEEEQIELNPLEILRKALKNCEPIVITKKVKRGGATYQVPYPLTKSQREYLSYKWIIKCVLERPKPRVKHFPEVMAQELLDASLNRGKVVKKRDDMHRLADANKAYAHYRWG